MAGRVHLLSPDPTRAACGAAISRRRGPLITSRVSSAVTCHNCLGTPRRTPGGRFDGTRAAQVAEYVAVTTLVGGERRLILPCECGALMVAGVDHVCDPATRAAAGAAMV